MTGKELYYSALIGEVTSRVPMFLEGFPLNFSPNENDFKHAWMAEPVYLDLYAEMSPNMVHRMQINLDEAINRRLCIPKKYIEDDMAVYDEKTGKRFQNGRIMTMQGILHYKREENRGVTTVWETQPPVNSIDELMQVFEIPFSVDENIYSVWHKRYLKYCEAMGDKGIVFFDLPSPIVAISNLMPFELFLELSLTENRLFHEILEEVTGRICLIMSEFLGRYNTKGACGYLGGSEQCTPPMMNPAKYEEFVVPYESRIAGTLKKFGLPAHVHCHGRVKHVLSCLAGMGISSIDPVEHPPSGDVTLEEAVRIADNKYTLVGNFNFDELEYSAREHIVKRTKEILSFRGQRIILSSSGGPISRVSPKLAENYRALLETYLAFA